MVDVVCEGRSHRFRDASATSGPAITRPVVVNWMFRRSLGINVTFTNMDLKSADRYECTIKIYLSLVKSNH